LNPVNPSIATTSSPSRKVASWFASQVLNACLDLLAQPVLRHVPGVWQSARDGRIQGGTVNAGLTTGADDEPHQSSSPRRSRSRSMSVMAISDRQSRATPSSSSGVSRLFM